MIRGTIEKLNSFEEFEALTAFNFNFKYKDLNDKNQDRFRLNNLKDGQKIPPLHNTSPVKNQQSQVTPTKNKKGFLENIANIALPLLNISPNKQISLSQGNSPVSSPEKTISSKTPNKFLDRRKRRIVDLLNDERKRSAPPAPQSQLDDLKSLNSSSKKNLADTKILESLVPLLVQTFEDRRLEPINTKTKRSSSVQHITRRFVKKSKKPTKRKTKLKIEPVGLPPQDVQDLFYGILEKRRYEHENSVEYSYSKASLQAKCHSLRYPRKERFDVMEKPKNLEDDDDLEEKHETIDSLLNELEGLEADSEDIENENRNGSFKRFPSFFGQIFDETTLLRIELTELKKEQVTRAKSTFNVIKQKSKVKQDDHAVFAHTFSTPTRFEENSLQDKLAGSKSEEFLPRRKNSDSTSSTDSTLLDDENLSDELSFDEYASQLLTRQRKKPSQVNLHDDVLAMQQKEEETTSKAAKKEVLIDENDLFAQDEQIIPTFERPKVIIDDKNLPQQQVKIFVVDFEKLKQIPTPDQDEMEESEINTSEIFEITEDDQTLDMRNSIQIQNDHEISEELLEKLQSLKDRLISSLKKIQKEIMAKNNETVDPLLSSLQTFSFGEQDDSYGVEICSPEKGPELKNLIIDSITDDINSKSSANFSSTNPIRKVSVISEAPSTTTTTITNSKSTKINVDNLLKKIGYDYQIYLQDKLLMSRIFNCRYEHGFPTDFVHEMPYHLAKEKKMMRCIEIVNGIIEETVCPPIQLPYQTEKRQNLNFNFM